MKGRRLPDGYEPTLDWNARLGIEHAPDGSYAKDSRGVWCVVTPNGRYGSLASHDVTENADGTITVSPSILVYPQPGAVYTEAQRADLIGRHGEALVREWEAGKPGYHGYLENGVWRDC